MGRPRNVDADRQRQIAEWTHEHGQHEAARMAEAKGWKCSAPTAHRYHQDLHPGCSADPAKQAEQRVQQVLEAQAAPAASMAPATPLMPIDAVLVAESDIRALGEAIAETPASQGRLRGQLIAQRSMALARLEALRTNAQPPEERRWRIALYLPQRQAV